MLETVLEQLYGSYWFGALPYAVAHLVGTILFAESARRFLNWLERRRITKRASVNHESGHTRI